MKNKIFNVPNYDGCGIYAIINSKNMMCYIGSSKNIKKRAIEHKRHLKNGKHSNRLLQKDYNKGSSFKFIIICKLNSDIDRKSLIAYEKMYMLSAINNYLDVYNLVPKTKWNKQKDWISSHLIRYFLGKYKICENFVNAFYVEYGTTPAYMHNRNPQNR